MNIPALEQSLGIPPGLYARLIKRGEASGATATSPAGAYGQAQLMPGTAAELGVDRYDPDQNLYGGALYLKQLLDRFHGDETKALEAYNEGLGRVNRGIVYPETAAYVHRVIGADVVPTTGTDASGGIMQALAPFLQQAISAQQPDATEQALFKKSQDQSDTTAQALEASRARYADLGQKMGQLKSPASINQADFQPPNPQDIQNQELAKVSNEPNQPLRALQQFLPLVAIFGGAFARRSGTAALDAATAAITAAKNNDQAAVEKAHQEFTDQMTALKERMDAAKTVYDENRNKYGDDMAGFAAQQSIQEAQDKNELALEALKTGQWEKYFQMKNAGLTAFDKILPVISAAQYHSDMISDRDKSLDPAKAAYWDAKNSGASEEDALNAMRSTELAEKPGLVGSQERQAKASFEKEPAVQAYQKAQPFFSAIEQAKTDPNYGKTVPEQQQILDSYIRIATGGQAIRAFMAKSAQDSFGLMDQAQVLAAKLAHGAMISPEAVKEYADAAAKIQDEMQNLYDKKLADDANTATRQGLDPSDILPTDDLDRAVGEGLVKPSGQSDPAQPALPSPGDIVKGYKFKGGDPADPKNWVKVNG